MRFLQRTPGQRPLGRSTIWMSSPLGDLTARREVQALRADLRHVLTPPLPFLHPLAPRPLSPPSSSALDRSSSDLQSLPVTGTHIALVHGDKV